MDRVLIVMDNVQFSGHLENTLRKIGYVTDTLQSEYNLAERLLSFNPDVIVARGTSNRLSTLNVGKRLKDNARYMGKAILIFNANNVPDEAQTYKLKVDTILEEPASALKIAVSILNLEPTDKSAMHEKLYKMVQDDAIFRQEEQSYLVQHGSDIEQELIKVKSTQKTPENDLVSIKTRIKNELQEQTRLLGKIENYNKQIDKIDVDLKKGLSKRKTKAENKANRKEWDIPASKEAQDLDRARKEFTVELFKKKPN